MNHNVHLCIKGCLTLKLSGSWNTVICSSPLGLALSPLESPPTGEMGIVERSTGDVGLSAVAGASRVAAAMISMKMIVMKWEVGL